ncbi:MBL fold metallo-hydrolase [Coraliomargarita parva]|uniref:MBL fold metallo-hydrolase n=1 Tax=Coraliomargarita parva TaxID=3014050 RepID=UPI0022B3B138|nr:MBL fold metallo-hydrolase [Coraliomargarita parva]
MLSDFQILGSSSSGNCALLRTGHTRILIDAGFSGKRIGQMLEGIGESLANLDAVFLTHEHQDHAQGLRGLSRRPDLPIFANRDTADAVQAKLCRPANWQYFETGASFRFRDIEICTFSLPHDAYDPVGYRFHWGEDDDLFSPRQGLAWVTDLGYVPENVRSHICEVETLVIEANYDENLLEQDNKRPWSTKQRIRGRHGHLSNDATFNLLESLNGNTKLRQVYLAHLSKDCNSVPLVREKFAPLGRIHANLQLHVVDPTFGIAAASNATM